MKNLIYHFLIHLPLIMMFTGFCLFSYGLHTGNPAMAWAGGLNLLGFFCILALPKS